MLVAPSQAGINVLGQVGRNELPELLDVLAVDGVGQTKSSIEDVGVESEEVLRDLAGSGILAVERSDESGLFAVVVELEVDGALGEHGTLELVQSTGNLGVLTSFNKAVLENISELEVAALH